MEEGTDKPGLEGLEEASCISAQRACGYIAHVSASPALRLEEVTVM